MKYSIGYFVPNLNRFHCSASSSGGSVGIAYNSLMLNISSRIFYISVDSATSGIAGIGQETILLVLTYIPI